MEQNQATEQQQAELTKQQETLEKKTRGAKYFALIVDSDDVVANIVSANTRTELGKRISEVHPSLKVRNIWRGVEIAFQEQKRISLI